MHLLLYHYHFPLCTLSFPPCRFVFFCTLFFQSSLLPFFLFVFDNMLERELLGCVVYCKLSGIISEAAHRPPERYQIIQHSPEYYSVLPFRIILKILAGNMLKITIKVIFPDLQAIDIPNIPQKGNHALSLKTYRSE